MPTENLFTVDPPYLHGTNTLKPGSVVGSDPWNDVWTGNYTETWTSVRSGGSQRQLAIGDLDPVPIPSGGLIDHVTFTAIVALTNELNGSGVRWGIDLCDFVEDPNDDGRLATITNDPDTGSALGMIEAPAADGTFYTMDFLGGVPDAGGWISPIDGDPLTSEYLTDIFRNGCRVVVRRYDENPPLPHDHGIKVAYLAGVLHWSGVTPAPPLRRKQRDDNALNNTRVSGHVSSKQASLRNRGYL